MARGAVRRVGIIMTRLIRHVVRSLPTPDSARLLAPAYGASAPSGEASRVALAVESMSRHMTDEGWQLMLGLSHASYMLAGRRCDYDETDVRRILDALRPGTVVVQDKREWDVKDGEFRDDEARFTDVGALCERQDVFKLTVLKDSHQRPAYHRESAEEMGVHGWVIYYHPDVVLRNAPYVRREHLVRTYHSLDPALVPEYGSVPRRSEALLSGAVSGVYPLRTRLINNIERLHIAKYVKHPGYHRAGCATPGYLKTLAEYRVAICTSSIYGYALRKIVEATACGCRVITDLPVDEVLPEIDGNLTRVAVDISVREMRRLLKDLCETYRPETQRAYAERAKTWYDYRATGQRLAQDIETLRTSYANGS